MKRNLAWRRMDVDYPESLRKELATFKSAALARLASHTGLVSISMMDAALSELETERKKHPELYLKLDRYRDCCLHRKDSGMDDQNYGYEEKEAV